MPKPREAKADDAESHLRISEGSELFTAIGCAACHTRDLGKVSGIYSDLLLHDMGSDLSDPAPPGAAAGCQPSPVRRLVLGFPLPPLASDNLIPADKLLPNFGGDGGFSAAPEEWRTPPLWGVRDSAPYLHDGRAATIEEAIALHDGEAKRSMRRFFELSFDQRTQVLEFLDTLVAPE